MQHYTGMTEFVVAAQTIKRLRMICDFEDQMEWLIELEGKPQLDVKWGNKTVDVSFDQA